LLIRSAGVSLIEIYDIYRQHRRAAPGANIHHRWIDTQQGCGLIDQPLELLVAH